MLVFYDPIYKLNNFQNHMGKDQMQLLIKKMISQEEILNSIICLLASFHWLF